MTSPNDTDPFVIRAPELDAGTGMLRCAYDHPEFGAFIETVAFPQLPGGEASGNLAQLAAIVMGTSYYKARPAGRIVCAFALTPAARRLAELTCGPGLGEFYVRNALTYPPALEIEAEEAAPALVDRPALNDPPRAVCAFGGGKDSHVAASILAEAGASVERASVFLSDKVAARMQTMSEAPLTFIQRTIDPRLIEISRSGQALNGHIPITAINSVLLTLHAEAQGLDWVVFANERAASEPTMEVNGHPVNHQFSKSLEFEDALRAAFSEAGARAEYFSILRPVSELWTAHYLAARSGALDIFASCNRNFVFAGPAVLEEGRRWCGQCAKCVYTAVLLAPFLSLGRHAAVFQSRPLHDRANVEFLREIAGLTDAKPWECVGERREVAAALAYLLKQADWREAPLVAGIETELFETWDRADLDAAWDEALKARSEHRMPEAVAQVMDA
ncbi:MAG: hypothetical protein NXI12_10700 [Alphaproteobacteria bacterium]|nr:hypothetical protein [Alphaproteobacteria bacterium]